MNLNSNFDFAREKVISIIENTCKVMKISLCDKWFSMGLSSLDMFKLTSSLSFTFGINPSPSLLFNYATPEALIRHLNRLCRQGAK